jgi:hypothetical protein
VKSSPHGGEHGGLDQLPLVDDQCVVVAERDEAQDRGDGVSDVVTVAVLSAMGPSVRLEDEAVADDEVDDADSGDPDLAGDIDPETVQSKPDE